MHQREIALLERAVVALEIIARNSTIYGRRTVAELDDLVAAVKQNDNVEASAIAAIQGLGQKLTDAIAAQKGIPDDVKAQLSSLANDINGNSAALAAAITANTPAAADTTKGDPGAAAPSGDAGPQASTAQS